MTHDSASNPVPLDEQAMIDAYFDRTLASEQKADLTRLLATDAGVGAHFAECAYAIEALRTPVSAPDFSHEILQEVGRRRGWLGARLQRFVSIGRLAAAAALLLALGVTLTVRRFAPDAAIFPQTPTPIADVAECASSDADYNVAGFYRVLDQAGSVTGLERLTTASPTAPVQAMKTMNAGLLMSALCSPSFMGSDPGRRKLDPGAWRAAGHVRLTIRTTRACSIRALPTRDRVGAVVLVARASAPASPNDGSKIGKDTPVGGW